MKIMIKDVNEKATLELCWKCGTASNMVRGREPCPHCGSISLGLELDMYDGWVVTKDEKDRAELFWDELWLAEFEGIKIGDEINLPDDWETQVRAGSKDGGVFNEMPDQIDEVEWWLARTDEETERLHKNVERTFGEWEQYKTQATEISSDGTYQDRTQSLHWMGGQIVN